MCNENQNNILELDFSVTNDANNWTTNSTNPVNIDNGVLVFNQTTIIDKYTRQLGSITSDRNRIRVSSNFIVKRSDVNSNNKTDVLVQLIADNVIYEEVVSFVGLNTGVDYKYFFDRVINYSLPTDKQCKLVLTVIEGQDNYFGLFDLKAVNYNFCSDNLRTYFVIDSLFDDAFNALSGGVKLLEYKIDGLETLTPDFIADTNIIGGNPKSQWNFAKSDLDGTDRVQENVTPNSFNFFEDEFKLTFDPAFGYKGGKANGTLNNKDYGQGILNFGVDKPEILNGAVILKKAPFFLDIDYTKDLKVVFDVVINKNNADLYVNPDYVRRYYIEWNKLTCEKKFYYTEKGGTTDQIVNGFLFGVTDVLADANIVPCDRSFSPTGNTGNFTYVIDFGSATGQVGIEYDSYGIPDRFILDWNGVVLDSGFVGSSTYDQQLIDAGVNPADINTASPTNGKGTLILNKTSAQPTQATVTVLAPLGSTGWVVKGICGDNLQPTNIFTEVGNGICGGPTPASWDVVYFNNQDLANYVPQNGDIVYSNPQYTTVFNGGNDTYRLRISNGATINILDYSFKIDTNGLISNVTSCQPVRLAINYNQTNKISVDNVDNSNVKTLSVEQFVETNPVLSGSDEIDLTLDYEIEGGYPDGVYSVYKTIDGGNRVLLAQQSGVGSKTGSFVIKLEPNKVIGIVQEMVYPVRDIAQAEYNRVFVTARSQANLDPSRYNVISGNFSSLVSNIGTILGSF